MTPYDNKFHGYGGSLGVLQPSAPLPIFDTFIQEAGEMEIPLTADVNGTNRMLLVTIS